MNKVDKLIQIIRNLKEEAVVSSGPTNAANTAGLGFDPNKETPPVFSRKNRYLGLGSRKRWMQRRNTPQV